VKARSALHWVGGSNLSNRMRSGKSAYYE